MNQDSHNKAEETLTQSERAAMRNNLSAFMAEHPAVAPLWLRFLDRLGAFFDTLDRSPLFGARMLIPAFSLVLVLGLGTSFAAERSLPGDALYPIKILFNEQITEVFQRSDSAKAEWESKLVSRRLEEVEALAVKGELTPVVREELQASIAVSAADFDASVAKLAVRDEEAVARAQSQFEASLTGHEQTLTALSNSRASSTHSVTPVLASISEHKRKLSAGRASLEAKIASKSGSTTRPIALVARKQTKSSLQGTKISSSGRETLSDSRSVTQMSAGNSVEESDRQGSGREEKKHGEPQESTHAESTANTLTTLSLFATSLATTSATSTATTTISTATSTATSTESDDD